MSRPRRPETGSAEAAAARMGTGAATVIPQSPPPAKPYGGLAPFDVRLGAGREGEAAVARWLEARGRRVTFLSEGACTTDGGPRLHTLTGATVAPDLLVTKPGGRGAKLVEVKLRSAASWYLRGDCWTTGISLLDLARLEEAEERVGLPCWLAVILLGKGDRFVHGAPPPPAGLYVAPAARLRAMMSHTFGNARVGYWRCDDLCRLAALDDLGVPA